MTYCELVMLTILLCAKESVINIKKCHMTTKSTMKFLVVWDGIGHWILFSVVLEILWNFCENLFCFLGKNIFAFVLQKMQKICEKFHKIIFAEEKSNFCVVFKTSINTSKANFFSQNLHFGDYYQRL